jgi:apolipoprotein N-acyltransferase
MLRLSQRLIAQLTSLYGVLGVVLSFVGLYGVAAYAVARRTSRSTGLPSSPTTTLGYIFPTIPYSLKGVKGRSKTVIPTIAITTTLCLAAAVVVSN